MAQAIWKQGKSCGRRRLWARGRRSDSPSLIVPDSTDQLLFPLGNADAQFANQTWCFGSSCNVSRLFIAVGRIQGAEGRLNTANPIFLSLLMLAASPVKPLMEL